MIERCKSMKRPGSREFRPVARMAACLVVLIFGLYGGAFAQSAPAQAADVISLHGRVFDAGHHALVGATVRLRMAGADVREISTDASGAFVFTALRAGNYQLRADKPGLGSGTEMINVSASAEGNEVDVTLRTDGKAAPADQMEFSDQPNFTVAGITDWTAVGGHGSDSILRTSETLARDTQGLKPEASAVESASPLNRDKRANSLPADQVAELSSIRVDAANGNLAAARLHVKAMIERQPSAELYGFAGDLDERLGDPLAAVRELEQAARLEPSEQNYFAWGSELLLHRAVWQAQEVFERGLKAYPRSARIETALGAALFAEARYEQAAERLCEASDRDPANTEPYLFIGKIGMVTPTSSPCLEEKLARFVREQPENSEASYLYAMTILKRQEQTPDSAAFAQAEGLLMNAVKYDSKCADGYLQLGIMQSSRHSFDRAIAYYTKAIDANPQLADAHYRLGVAYDRTGKRDKAEAEFRVHDELVKNQSDAVEAQRREVKQFLVVLNGKPGSSSTD